MVELVFFTKGRQCILVYATIISKPPIDSFIETQTVLKPLTSINLISIKTFRDQTEFSFQNVHNYFTARNRHIFLVNLMMSTVFGYTWAIFSLFQNALFSSFEEEVILFNYYSSIL